VGENAVFDVVIIGGGPGGYTAAIRAAQLGLTTALVEKGANYGGTCVNSGCIPAKSLLDATELYSVIREKSAIYGISFENLKIDLSTVMKKKREAIEKLSGGIAILLKQNGVTTFRGSGRLSGADGVVVKDADGTESLLMGRAIILASGSVPATFPALPFDGKTIVGSDEALSFQEIPERLLVVGADAIGIELGSVWARLGSSVTIAETADQILPGVDPQAARALMQALKKRGIDFLLSTEIVSCSVGNGIATVGCRDQNGGALFFKADKVLVAVGRKADIESLGLADAGITLTDRGKVKVDAKMRTSRPNVYAIGDIVDGPMLAHKAAGEGLAAAENIAGKAGSVNYETIPFVVYAWPELATVGRTENRCKEEAIPYRTGIFRFVANGRAVTSDSAEGFVKIVAHRDTDRVLGGVVVGARASDLISEIVTVMEFGGSSEDIARTLHAHPTFSEAVKEAAMDVEGRSIHFHR